jgi:hypothetical protein
MDLEESGSAIIEYYPDILLEGLGKITNISDGAETRSEHFPITSLEHDLKGKLFS